ncbi:unnamed protein product [Mytilus coruscus]|uniref:VWFD domain-containing protein n=1 Tax=Mytilus coruscus TaxID=42192 RepID=A0A6J8BKR0_MYTCO|nr:unnamed protein product [Mytilus coruscus]
MLDRRYRLLGSSRVRCSVRSRDEYFIQTGPPYESEIYIAGLIPEKCEYNVQEGSSITIRYNVTVFIGCLATDLLSGCQQKFYVSLPSYQDHYQCSASQYHLHLRRQPCGLVIHANDWKKPIELVVHGKTNGLNVEMDRTTFIHLKSIDSLTGVWNYARIPEVKVVVSRAVYNMTGRQCHSYNDPHIRTADGTKFDTTEQGEFIMYRSKRGPYAVHVLFGSCGTDTALASCNCGVAIKNNRSLFLVTLPTGTEIEFYISNGFIPVLNIKPSVIDVGNTEGLCGFISLDGNANDDLISRDSPLIGSDVPVFVASWRATSDEELFVIEPNLPITYPFLKQFCGCHVEDYTSDYEDNYSSVECSLSESMVPCLQIQNSHFKSFENTCEPSNNKRRKRSSGNQYVKFPVNDPDNVMDMYWTDYRNDSFDQQSVPQSAGDTSFLKDTVMAIQLFSKKEAHRYNSMNDVSMLFQRVNTVLCVDNCNGKGQCISGKCLCNDDYIGLSCSSHISTPRQVLSLPEDGLCDSVARPCRKTNIYGEFYSKDIICKSENFLVSSICLAND